MKEEIKNIKEELEKRKEEAFKGLIQELKESNVNPNDAKKYILAIKRVIQVFYANCKSELSEEEVISEFIEEYFKDLEFRGNVEVIFDDMSKYELYKKVLQEFKGNKNSFNSVVREAKKFEKGESGKVIDNMQPQYRKDMVATVRYIMITKGVTRDNDIVAAIEVEKAKLEQDFRKKMINIIHSSVGMLDEYGFLDEYIEISNEDLEKLGLAELKFSKRNPIPEEQYDLEGNLVKDVEDIGVIDTLSEEELEKISLEELQCMTAFYESKYLQERLGLSKAMSVIKSLNLWDVILHGEDKDIEEFDDEKIKAALKKDIAISALSKNVLHITNKMRKQYRKFLKSQGMNENEDIEEEVNEIAPEIANLESTAADIAILEGLIIQQLQNKNMKVKSWGVLEVNGSEVIIAIENKKFRGPLIMAVSKETIERFCGTDESKFPSYEKEIDETHSNIMSKLYTTSNNFYRNAVSKAYAKNPESKVIADLAER